MVTILHHSPEIMLAFLDFIDADYNDSFMGVKPHTVFSFFFDSLHGHLSEFVEHYITAYLATFALVTFIYGFTNMKVAYPLDAPMVRFQNYLFALGKEFRVQFEIALMVFFFAVMYVSMMLSMFDDSNEEMIEGFMKTFFYMFLFTLAILV